MAAYLFSAAWLPADHYTRHVTPDKAYHELIGRITSPLDRDPDRTAFVLELSKIDSTPVTGKVRMTVREALQSVGYGDTVRIKAKMFEPGGYNNPGGFDYPGYLARSGIAYIAFARNAEAIQVLSRNAGAFRKIQDWREQIRQSFLASTSGPGSAILQAMVLGEEGGLTDELRDRFMAAGVTHIISISGSHLGMVAVLCFGLIRGLLFMMPERCYHAYGPETYRGLAHPSARCFLYTACGRAGGNGPLARYDSGGTFRRHPEPRACAYALPCSRCARNPHRKSAGGL
jgi:competence protein ComEC